MRFPLRILAMSDLHGEFSRFPVAEMPRPGDANLVIVAGDLTDVGMQRPQEIDRARAFLNRLSFVYTQVAYILGNHDLGIMRGAFEQDFGFMDGGRPQLTTELSDTRQEIQGFTIVGINLSPCFDAPELKTTWRNMTDNPAIDAAAFAALPPAEIVVSHCPPWGLLDTARGESTGNDRDGQEVQEGERHIGSPGLLDYIRRHKPRLVICGHVHEAAGEATFAHEDGSETLIHNVARTWRLIELP